MNVVGIIAEYNPFHKGHQYHIHAAKAAAKADYTIAIISGSFVQRGCCAVADKYSRTRAALLCGADLVLELPVLFATSSAELFARGGVSALDKLGIVTHLAFGSESDDTGSIQALASVLACEPATYQNCLKKHLAQGLSFPAAREQALTELYPELCQSIPLNQPNVILGIEYCKALRQLHSRIRPLAVRRRGSAYHQTEPDVLFSSATSIRQQLHGFDHSDIQNPNYSLKALQQLRTQLPERVFPVLEESLQYSFPIFDEDLSALVRFALFNVSDRNYTPYLDVSEELSNRIRRNLFCYESFHQFAALLKTKDLTYSRICRCLLHILLGITKKHVICAEESDYVPYFRILGMKSSAAPLLKAISNHSDIPVITSPAAYLKPDSKDCHSSKTRLSASARTLLELDCHATHIWNGIAGEKFGHATECEYSRKFMKL